VSFEKLEAGSLERHGISRRLSVNARALGPRLGKQVQSVIQSAKAGDWEVAGDGVRVGEIDLLPGEFELELHSADEASAIAFLSDGGFVILDTEMTPELEAEGLARDVIRAIQDTRKAAGLNVSDRITLSIVGDAADLGALSAYEATIAAETLATDARFTVGEAPEVVAAVDGSAGGQRTTLAAGQYANTGVLVIDVRKAGAVNV